MKLKKTAMKDLTMVNFLNSEKLDQSFDNLSSFMDERDEAYRNFKNIGIPSKRNERWKYTDLKNDIRDIDFSFEEVGILLSLKYFPTIAPNRPSLWPDARIFILVSDFQQ